MAVREIRGIYRVGRGREGVSGEWRGVGEGRGGEREGVEWVGRGGGWGWGGGGGVYLHQLADKEQGGKGLRAELRTWRASQIKSQIHRVREIIRKSKRERVRVK